MPYRKFDRSRLKLKPLSERVHDLDISAIMALDAQVPPYEHPDLDALAQRIVAARRRGGEVVLMMGAHVIRKGNSRFIVDLIKRRILTHVAGNGACAIHDFEFALIGATTESVARYISEGQFGLWKETGWLNDAVNAGASEGLGYGEAVGKWIVEHDFPYREISVFAAAYEQGVPATVHIGIGADITHEHPNFDPCAAAEASYRDFLTLADTLSRLEGGVFMNFGSAVTGPETYLKALAMARNVAKQQGRTVAHFTTAVFDLVHLGSDYHRAPSKDEPHYYFRPWKTILVRTVHDGGESFYFQGDHAVTFPNLYRRIVSLWDSKDGPSGC